MPLNHFLWFFVISLWSSAGGMEMLGKSRTFDKRTQYFREWFICFGFHLPSHYSNFGCNRSQTLITSLTEDCQQVSNSWWTEIFLHNAVWRLDAVDCREGSFMVQQIGKTAAVTFREEQRAWFTASVSIPSHLDLIWTQDWRWSRQRENEINSAQPFFILNIVTVQEISLLQGWLDGHCCSDMTDIQQLD